MSLNSRFLKITLILFSSFLIFGCTQTVLDNSPEYVPPVYMTLKVVDENNETFYFDEVEVEPGTNAFVAMKENLGSTLKYQEYDFGIFVEEIANKAAPEGHFYKLYVNGKEAELGISSYTIEENIIIEWQIVPFEKY